MKIVLRVHMVLLILCIVSCKAQKDVDGPDTDLQSKITLVEQDDYIGFAEYNTMVIRDFKSLAKFYAEVNKTRKPGLPIPKIDFSKETVLIVCAGEQKGDSKMSLSLKEETDNELIMKVERKTETSQDLSSSMATYPFYIYKIPLTSKSIVFETP